jgi:hypothetical protein
MMSDGNRDDIEALLRRALAAGQIDPAGFDAMRRKRVPRSLSAAARSPPLGVPRSAPTEWRLAATTAATSSAARRSSTTTTRPPPAAPRAGTRSPGRLPATCAGCRNGRRASSCAASSGQGARRSSSCRSRPLTCRCAPAHCRVPAKRTSDSLRGVRPDAAARPTTRAPRTLPANPPAAKPTSP